MVTPYSERPAERLIHRDEPPSRLDEPAETDRVFWMFFGAIRSPEKFSKILQTSENSHTFQKIQANQTTTK